MRTKRAKRRQVPKGEGIEHMSDEDLQAIRFFGYLVGRDRNVVYAATPEEQRRAVEILEKRGTLNK